MQEGEWQRGRSAIGGPADDGKRLWCWTLYNEQPAGTEEMLSKKMKIYMDKGGGSGRGNGNGIGAGSGGRRITGSEGDDNLQADCWSRAVRRNTERSDLS